MYIYTCVYTFFKMYIYTYIYTPKVSRYLTTLLFNGVKAKIFAYSEGTNDLSENYG